MVISKSKRNQFIASHLEPHVKEELRDRAKNQNVSMSKFIADAVEEKLEREVAVVEEK